MAKRKLPSVNSIQKIPRTNTGFWANKLIDSMNDPDLIVLENNNYVAIKDKYPKALHHYLILPKKDISSILMLKPDDLSILKELEDMAKEIINTTKLPRNVFNIGYHAFPSMQRLHLHVISKDFKSPCLKTKDHWNSFTTDFFIPSGKLRSELEANGEVKTLASSLKQFKTVALKCHVCDEFPKNMPALKRHIESHEALFVQKADNLN